MTDADTFYSFLSTTRSIRRISNRVVDDETLERVLQAAVWAPSGGNRQPWRMIAIRDPDVKRQIGDLYADEWAKYVDFNMQKLEGQSDDVRNAASKGLSVGTKLAASLADIPVIVIFVHEQASLYITDLHYERASVVGGASLYPAVQNLLLAARVEGLGGVLTTLISAREQEVQDILHIPRKWGVHAMVPLGYPQGQHGPLSRAPLHKMVKYDRWTD